MLIRSKRHTSDDLALWAELEAADLAAPFPENRVNESITAITKWEGDVICTSWGKDSVVMLHLFAILQNKLPVVWVRMRGRDNPDCIKVRDVFLREWPMEYHERSFVYENCQRDEHWKTIADEFGVRRATGIRADESKSRALSFWMHGMDTGVSFRPMAKWRLPHIFAYAAQMEIPLHPAYACNGNGRWPRKSIRVHSIGGQSGRGYGRSEWETEYYPDVMRRLGQ